MSSILTVENGRKILRGHGRSPIDLKKYFEKDMLRVRLSDGASVRPSIIDRLRDPEWFYAAKGLF